MNNNNNIYDGRDGIFVDRDNARGLYIFPCRSCSHRYLHNRFYIHVSTMYNNNKYLLFYEYGCFLYRPYTMKSRPWYSNFSSPEVYSRVFFWSESLCYYVLIVTFETLCTLDACSSWEILIQEVVRVNFFLFVLPINAFSELKLQF